MSARVTDAFRTSVKETVQSYLNRHTHSVQQFPDVGLLRKLHLAGMTVGEKAAFDGISAHWDEGSARQSYRPVRYFKAPAFMCMGLQLAAQDNKALAVLHVKTDDLLVEPGPGWPAIPHSGWINNPIELRRCCDEDLYAKTVEWIKTCMLVYARVERTYFTIESLLEMSNTPGQLFRMAPDLLKLMPVVAKETVAASTRRSPFPPEWMETNRTLVRDACEHLALCHLLPRMENGPERYAAVQRRWVTSMLDPTGFTWAWSFDDRTRLAGAEWAFNPTDDAVAEWQIRTLQVAKESSPIRIKEAA